MSRTSALWFALLTASLANAVERPSRTARQSEVAVRGAEVMPFELDATRHQFVKAPDGGLQRVVVLDAQDRTQVVEVRAHLAAVAAAFAQRDFGDPRSIHGDAMPGLATLERAPAAALEISYAARPDGAEIRYSSDEPEIVEALHRWFDAQVDDHGDHASHH